VRGDGEGEELIPIKTAAAQSQYRLRSKSMREIGMTSECGDNCGEPCRTVVTRTYTELRALGADDPSAFRSAVTVMALRHPQESRRALLAQVADWLSDED